MLAKSILIALALTYGTHAHSLLLSVTGANGVTGTGIGVVATTPRNGNDQSDTTRVQGDSGCGSTQNGPNDIPSFVADAVSSGLATASADGSVSMTLHQVNGDGAGPFICEVSTDASGGSFVAMTVTTDVPGNNGNSGASAQDFPLVAQLPAGTSCTGGANGDACLVRCRQPGGFGGCVAVTAAAGAGGGAGNNNGNGNAGDGANAGNNGNGANGGNNNNNADAGAGAINGTGGNAGNANANNANNAGRNGGRNRNNRNNRMMLVRSPIPIAVPEPVAAPLPEPGFDKFVARVKRSRIARGTEVA